LHLVANFCSPTKIKKKKSRNSFEYAQRQAKDKSATEATI